MRKGFTLIELMLSVVILGFGLVIIIQSFLLSLNGLNISQNYIKALSFAQDKLTALELAAYENNGLLPGLAPESGKEHLGSREFTWVSEVKEIIEPDYLTEELVQGCIKLNWKERNINRDISLANYFPRKKEE